MTRILVKTDAVTVDGQTYPVGYFALSTLRGLRRYSAEISLGPGDRVILDGDSMINLEVRTSRMLWATVHSRALAGTL